MCYLKPARRGLAFSQKDISPRIAEKLLIWHNFSTGKDVTAAYS